MTTTNVVFIIKILFCFRLCINYTNADGGTVTLNSIMQDCMQYFKDNLLCPPTKDIVARLLPHLFGTETFFFREQGKRYVAYRNIVPRFKKSPSSIILPGLCVQISLVVTDLKLKVPMMTVINGHQEYCEVYFHSQKVIITFRNLTIQIGFKMELQQINVDGVVHLVTKMRFCNGMESIADESCALDVTEVSYLHQENSGTKRSWSKSCKTLLTWSTKKEACKTCIDSIIKNRRRKAMIISE
jgi:hypothetical protein